MKILTSEGEEELDEGTCMKLPGSWLELEKQTVSPAAKLLPSFQGTYQTKQRGERPWHIAGAQSAREPEHTSHVFV